MEAVCRRSTIIISGIKGFLRNAFDKHLLATNIAISLSLSGTGDILQQHYNQMIESQRQWDRVRTRHMTYTGITIGILCHKWYIFLDKKLPGRSGQIVFKKLLADQLFFSPICIWVFFLTLGIFRRKDLEEFIEEVKQKGWRLYAAEWVVWPPAQIINFYWLPTKYRVLYDNTISLLYDVYTSYICHEIPLEFKAVDGRTKVGQEKQISVTTKDENLGNVKILSMWDS
ncbi:mpv17-like protein 2 [Oratosquilla oratoria]|uniref:mpv17-like protein 2 n=1 Tax=Oratosquilla oratoria TaxID=337810 RepID=UPI003F76360F